MISSSQRPLPDNTQHSQQTNIYAHCGIRTHNLSRRAAADLRLRPRGYWHRQLLLLGLYTYQPSVTTQLFEKTLYVVQHSCGTRRKLRMIVNNEEEEAMQVVLETTENVTKWGWFWPGLGYRMIFESLHSEV